MILLDIRLPSSQLDFFLFLLLFHPLQPLLHRYHHYHLNIIKMTAMTAEETLPMHPAPGDPTQKVPRLEGAANFALWQSCLKSALDNQDETLWAILQGTSKPSDLSVKSVPKRAEILQSLEKNRAKHLGPPTDEEVKLYIDENYVKPNGEVKNWLAKDKKVHEFLMSTLEGHVKDRVANTKHAFEAYNILKNLYRSIAPNIVGKWTNWINDTFDEGLTAEGFVTGWNKSLKEVLDTCGQDAVSPRAQICQFIVAATFEQERVRAWARHLRVDLNAPDALDRVQADFMMDQGSRVDPDYFGTY